MSNRKFTTARAAAFWFGLVLHLGLGTALYYHISDSKAVQDGRTKSTVHVMPTPAKP